MKPMIRASRLCRELGLPRAATNYSYGYWIKRVPAEQKRKLAGRHFLTDEGAETLRRIAASVPRESEQPSITTDWNK